MSSFHYAGRTSGPRYDMPDTWTLSLGLSDHQPTTAWPAGPSERLNCSENQALREAEIRG